MNTRPEEKLLKISNNFQLLSQLKKSTVFIIYIYIYIYFLHFLPLIVPRDKAYRYTIRVAMQVKSTPPNLLYVCSFFFFFHSPLVLFEMRTKLGKRYYILYHTKSSLHKDTITFCNLPKPQFSKLVQNRTQEPSFTLNTTQGSEKRNQMPSSFTSLISLDI